MDHCLELLAYLKLQFTRGGCTVEPLASRQHEVVLNPDIKVEVLRHLGSWRLQCLRGDQWLLP